MHMLQAQMESREKEKGDMFDIMVVDEAKIRLGEEGWKERYYQVLFFLLQYVRCTCDCCLCEHLSDLSTTGPTALTQRLLS